MRSLQFLSGLLAVVLSMLVIPSLAGEPSRAGTTARSNPLLKLGNLVTLCDRKDASSRMACGSYITGFVAGSQASQTAAVVKVVADQVIEGRVAPTEQAMDAAGAKLHGELDEFCIRSNWTAGYVQSVVVQYGREHSDELEENTADHMFAILAKAFPCADSHPRQPPN